jgi:hypothetical protein
MIREAAKLHWWEAWKLEEMLKERKQGKKKVQSEELVEARFFECQCPDRELIEGLASRVVADQQPQRSS